MTSLRNGRTDLEKEFTKVWGREVCLSKSLADMDAGQRPFCLWLCIGVVGIYAARETPPEFIPSYIGSRLKSEAWLGAGAVRGSGVMSL